MREGEGQVAEDHDEGDDLDEGVELAEEAGVEVAEGVGGEEQRGDEQDAEVAAEDEHGDVTRHESDVGEDEEESAEEELVGDGIEIEAEGGALGEPAGEQAVECVGDAGEHEEGEGDLVAAVEYLDDEEWNDEEPHDGEEVGRGAELAQERHCVC